VSESSVKHNKKSTKATAAASSQKVPQSDVILPIITTIFAKVLKQQQENRMHDAII
jgi:hypothetical protein